MRKCNRVDIAYLVSATGDSPLEHGWERHKHRPTGIDPDILVRNVIAGVVVDVECPPGGVRVRDGHADPSVVFIPLGETWRQGACPSLVRCSCRRDVPFEGDGVAAAHQPALGVALEGRLWYGHDGCDVGGAFVVCLGGLADARRSGCNRCGS